MQALEQMLRKFSAKMKRQFAKEIARDPAKFKKQAVRLLRRTLPPGRGRPNNPRYDEAARMADQGKAVGDILRSLDPSFDSLDPWTRMLAARGLRAALRRRGRQLGERV